MKSGHCRNLSTNFQVGKGGLPPLSSFEATVRQEPGQATLPNLKIS
jgi:hypothetical protein